MDISNWVKVFSSSQAYICELKKALLENNHIPALIINKTDSMHRHLFNGEHELYVPNEEVIKAKHLLQKNDL